MSQIQDIVQ